MRNVLIEHGSSLTEQCARPLLTPISQVLLTALVGFIAACSGSVGVDPEPDTPEPSPYLAPTRVIAAAGADREVLEGSRVLLDGNASRALDGPLVLTWSQTSGTPVLLTNPSGANPTFVAPLAPDLLTFQLRAESGVDSDVDVVQIIVSASPQALPTYLEVPADIVADVQSEVSFSTTLHGDPLVTPTYTARPHCDATVTVSAQGDVDVDLGDELPCAITVSARGLDGRESSRGVFVVWPAESVLPPPTTFLQTPTVLGPGEEATLRLDNFRQVDASATSRTWSTGQLIVLDEVSTESNVAFTAPRQRGRIALVSEVRSGARSGGLRFVLAEVTAGAGNRAPVANGGPNREVRPGGAFAIDVSRSNDLDNDPLDVRVIQVAGREAIPDPALPRTFQAPESEGVLLFHVIANDGVVDSAPASVRVSVTADAPNAPPVLTLDPIRYVQPNLPFVLDASTAVDDSGVISRYSISQEPSDATILLSAPVDTATTTITAGAEGDIYHFRLSAFDVEGLQGFADIEVRVETAGPYVDPTRGTPDGDGTVASPFSTLTAAVDVAARHRLSELRLVAGQHAPWTGEYPPGLSMRGGFRYDGDTYVDDATEETVIPVGDLGIDFSSSSVSTLVFRLTDPSTSISVSGTTSFTDVDMVESAVHSGPLLTVTAGASTNFVRGTIHVSATTESVSQPAVKVDGSTAAGTTSVDFADVDIFGGIGGTRAGIRCTAADISLSGGRIVGGSRTEYATGIAATDCNVELLGTTVIGGDASGIATGLDLLRTILFVDSETTVFAVHVDSDAVVAPVPTPDATGVRVRGPTPGVIRGTVYASDGLEIPVRGTGVVSESSSLTLQGATIEAVGIDLAVGVDVRAPDSQFANCSISAAASGRDDVSAASAIRLQGTGLLLDACHLNAEGLNARGVTAAMGAINHGARFLLTTISVRGERSAAGLSLPNASGVLVSGGTIDVDGLGEADPVRGLSVLQGTLRSATINVHAPLSSSAVIFGTDVNESMVERTTLRASSETANATALLSTGDVATKSSAFFATTSSNDGVGVGIEARGDLVLVHATIFATDRGLTMNNPERVSDLANSVFVAPTGVFLAGLSALPAATSSLAFDGDILVARAKDDITDVKTLSSLGCSGCMLFDAAQSLDDDARLLSGVNALVDTGSTVLTDAVDIDGDARPQGIAPDIGCDERLTGD